MTTSALERATWPMDRAGEAIRLLARAAGLPVRAVSIDRVPAGEGAALDACVEAWSLTLGVDMVEIEAPVEEISSALAQGAPSVLQLRDGADTRAVAVLRVAGPVAVVLAPDGERVRVPLHALRLAARGEAAPDVSDRVERLLDLVKVSPRRRARARDALLERMMASRRVRLGWALRLPPSAPFLQQLMASGTASGACITLGVQLAQQALGVAGWWLVGRGALEGEMAPGWLVAWALVLVSAVPARFIASWTQGTATVAFAVRLKRRLLHGALHLAPEEVRNEGAGQMLGRVMESAALESLVTNGGLTALPALAEAIVTIVVLSLAPGGAAVAIAFACCIGLGIALSSIVGRHVAGWTRERLAMTQDLVERMVGHRTRLAQEPRERWHGPEDQQLTRYAERSASLDRGSAFLQGALPRLWMVLGVAGLAPSFVRGETTGADLALAIGGLVLGYRALAHLTTSVTALLRARSAWEQTRPLFEAGARQEQAGSPSWAATRPASAAAEAVEMRNVHFRYAGRLEPVLRGVNLRLEPRDRVLVEGPSGGGKSTLGAVLTGLRAPDAGLVLVGGLDKQTLGDLGWRRRIVSAPQFHENHLICAPLAFNLLMGRRWPPSEEDLRLAHEVCGDLGLAALIARMPGGIMQMVGETGWQLSHGERSRVFIARALLQSADVVVLDESFAALDPETLGITMRGVERRAPALVVIAHP